MLQEGHGRHDEESHDRCIGPSLPDLRGHPDHATTCSEKDRHIADRHPSNASEINFKNIIQKQFQEDEEYHKG